MMETRTILYSRRWENNEKKRKKEIVTEEVEKMVGANRFYVARLRSTVSLLSSCSHFVLQ